MLITLGIAYLQRLTGALTTNKVLHLELFHACALLFTSKVRVFALEAHKVVQLVHRISLQVIEELAVRVLECSILLNTLMLGPLQGHLSHFGSQLLVHLYLAEQLWVVRRRLDCHLAGRAIHELKIDGWRVPFTLDFLHNAIYVENVATLEHD